MGIGKAAPLLLLFFFGKQKKPAAKVIKLPAGVFDGPGGEEPEEPVAPFPAIPGVHKARVVFNELVKPSPTVDAAYTFRKDDRWLGPNGVCARALTKVLGRTPTPTERQRYYEACTRVRTNWILYSTDTPVGSGERVTVTGLDGTQAVGSVTAIAVPVNDPWVAATSQGRVPNRVINWKRNRNPNNPGERGAVVPVGNWQSLVAAQPRTFGTAWLPRLEAMNVAAAEVTKNAAYDWPAAFWDAVGRPRLLWGGLWT